MVIDISLEKIELLLRQMKSLSERSITKFELDTAIRSSPHLNNFF